MHIRTRIVLPGCRVESNAAALQHCATLAQHWLRGLVERYSEIADTAQGSQGLHTQTQLREAKACTQSATNDQCLCQGSHARGTPLLGMCGIRKASIANAKKSLSWSSGSSMRKFPPCPHAHCPSMIRPQLVVLSTPPESAGEQTPHRKTRLHQIRSRNQ